MQATGMEMLCGGAGLLILGAATGEASRMSWAAFTPRAVACLLYLSFAASVVAFTSYMWLLTRVSPTRVSTYAYVNPVIAMLLGWAVGGEELTLRALLAAVVILGGVVLILSASLPGATTNKGAGRDE
jgi:drug/metabolite transporter (DMT)-like permease